MVARSASGTPSFTPAERPRIAVSADGALAAISEPSRVVVVALPDGQVIAEVGVDGDAGATEVVWVAAPPRLLVLSRFASHSTVHLLDPHGPRTLAEIRLESPMRLFASVGAHALAVGAMGAAVLSVSGDSHLTPYQFPARAVPIAAGAAAGQFVVALPNTVEEWDPASRMPKRRLRLPRPAVITALGGSERLVWVTTQQDPTRIDVMPLVNRGQPKSHELPEPISMVSGHPKSDVVLCVGADTGRLFAVDLDGRTRLRVIAAEGIDRIEAAALAIGRSVSVVAAQARRPLAVLALDGRELEPVPVAKPAPVSAPIPTVIVEARRSTLSEADAAPPTPRAAPQSDPEPHAPIRDEVPEPAPAIPEAKPSLFRPATAAPAPVVTAAVPVVAATSQDLSQRFATWRDRMRLSQPRSDQIAALPAIDPRPSWRDAVVTWARAVAAGSVDRNAPDAPPIDDLAARFELPQPLVPALVLLYGAHLGGEHGVAPVDIARVLGRRWDEALGRGQLATRGLATYEGSRVILAASITAALDERAPATGTMVGEPGAMTLLGPCVVIAGDGPLGLVAEHCLPSVGGAILAAHPDVDPAALFLEARARGAAPMLRVSPGQLEVLPTDAAIFVVADEQLADALGVPRLS